MPITRYQIRNEYSLADPELYLAANKDDPEALLEGVAMAGLVGVLRQLGDLSEFAAEIFHSLHEEVMVTAARGHSLTARVQQLEAEVPLIEKAILSQTNHSSSLHTAGVEWHPNLRMNQNMITQGDLPRFVMDSYEECRGPPRLFILDKFDIAGAGACLKRYTNPSFFKVEPASSGTPNVDSQRDRRIRKVKKKGARGRNGETPEILPTSNVKLHRLFLEDRAENSGSEPARLVKLKKRHLQGSPFNSQTGKSYMQKLFQTSPEHKFVRDIPIDPPSDNLISNSSAHGPKILDIQTVSSATESLQSIRDRYETPTAQETVQNSSMDEMSEEVSDGENLHMAAIGHDHEMDKVMSMLYKTADEKKLAVDRESTPESSVNESEIDVASETDNFMDALNSLESEIETDTECRRKNSLNLFNGEKHGADSDANNEPNKDLSANGFLPFSKGTASSSYSDLSGLAGAGSAEVAAVESVDMSFDKMCIGDEVLGTKSRQDSAANSRCSEVSVVPTIHAEHDKLPLDGECSGDVSSAGSEGKFDTDELGRELFNTDTNGNSTGEILPMVTVSSIPSLKTVLPSESCQSINLDSGLDPEENDINVVLHTDDDSCRSSLSECSEHLLSDLEPDCEDNCIENVENAVDENVIRYYSSKVSSTEAQILSSTFPEPEPLSGITQQPNALQASTTDNSEDPAPLVDNPQLKSSSEQKSSERTYSFQAIDRNLVETGVLHSQETTVNGGVCSTKDFGEIDASACNGDGIARKIVSSKFSSEYPDYETFEDQVHEHTRIRNVPAKAEGGMAPSIAVSVNNGRQSSNLLLEMPCSSSRNSMDMQDSLSISACPQQKRVEMHESSPPECHVESDVPAKQSMASSGATRDDEHNNISPIRDVTTSELQTEQETELETHHPTRTLDISKTFGSVRTRHTLDPGYHTKQIVEGQADQLDAATPKFSFSHYEQESELNDISQDRYLSTTRESSLDDLPGQASISNSSLQSTSVKLESYEKAMATSLPFFPKVSLLSPGSQVSIEEPPHLPPLPPLQWRVGKLPHEHSFDSFPPIPPPTDNENAQSDAITSTENQQSHNPFLQPSDIINNESQYVTADFAGPSPLSLPIPTTVTSSADNQYLTTSIGSKQSLNPFVSLPSSPERPQDSSVTVEEKRTHHASNVLSLETPVENANSAEDKELEHNFQNSREKVSNLMLFHPPPLVENLQPQFGQEGPGEISNPNENTTVKLPRPRNPLIDAVAAHGKNSLRKVIERARPPIEKEVEERDTMLEQIRNKTFNLKPAVPIRPRIQPPQTNLKMAAILEKANKIRQATVGSDEDDDDNWSDD